MSEDHDEQTVEQALAGARSAALDAEDRRRRTKEERWRRVEGHELDLRDRHERWIGLVALAAIAMLALSALFLGR